MRENLSTPSYLPPKNQGLDLLYIDEFLIALNKPGGLLSVPGRGSEKSDCLLSRAMTVYPGTLTVHRLDMATSGIIILARTKDIQRKLGLLFEQRQIEKHYSAIVDGKLKFTDGKIDFPLINDWPNRPRQKIDQTCGKKALTFYEVLNYNRGDNTSLLQVKPVTGRSHQIRVHLQAIGHAILGDHLYAPPSIAIKSPRLLLHANRLDFIHPVTHQPLKIACPAPFIAS